MKTGRILAIWLFAVTGLMAGAWAQDYPAGPNGEAAPASDGPAPDVARVSLIHGDVSMQRGDTGDWAVTSINAPLVRGDQVATGEKSRTEIQLDYANILRLAARSQAKIADLTRTHIQIQVAQGYANYTMLKGSEAEVEIDTPNVSVRPLRHGRYRVQVNSDAETDVIVRDGEAEITTPQGSTRVKEGEMITIRGTDQPEYKVSSAPGKDDWDRWNKDRDSVIRDAHSWGNTNRYYTGVNDLDAYGHWVWVPGYGNVWSPYQQAAWAPYQTGRWVYEPYYGWTWVSYEPWGWAPYHYGRWFYYRDNWCWWPGPVFVGYRPIWSPAFVFFVGFGHHSGFGFGSIGWFPVGPHDPFYPWYGRGFNRVNVVNITNVTNITNITNVTNVHNVVQPLAVRGRQPYYSNANLALTNPRVRGSITSVSSENFGRGGHEGWRHGVDEHELRESSVMTANLPVVPSRESLHAGRDNLQVPVTVQPKNVDRFYTRHQPPAGPESFHDQMQRVQRVVGPEAAGASSSGAQGNVRTDVHAGPEHVDRRDIGGNASGNVNAKTGIAQVPRTDKSTADKSTTGATTTGGAAQQPSSGNDSHGDNSPGGFRRFGAGNGPNNAGIVPKDNPAHTSTGASESATHNNPAAGGANASGGNGAQDNKRGDRGGWNKFGPPSGRATGDTGSAPSPRSNDQGRVPRTDSTPASTSPASPSRTQEDRSGWQKFPANNSSNDRGTRSIDSPATRNDRVNSGDRSGGSKPPLELHRPIVTPRQPDVRNQERTTPPPPARTPEVHNEPRYSPPPTQRSETPRYSPPSRSESPRYSPPSHSESHGGSSSSHGDSSSSHSGSSDRGGHSDSKSSSGPKQH